VGFEAKLSLPAINALIKQRLRGRLWLCREQARQSRNDVSGVGDRRQAIKAAEKDIDRYKELGLRAFEWQAGFTVSGGPGFIAVELLKPENETLRLSGDDLGLLITTGLQIFAERSHKEANSFVISGKTESGLWIQLDSRLVVRSL
jgi:hypothetical protein